MKRLIPIALVALALAAAPAALADNVDYGTAPAPPAATAPPAGDQQQGWFGQRFAAHLVRVDTMLQHRIAKLKETCTTTTTDTRCKNADQRIARLQAIDDAVRALVEKLRAIG